MLQSFNKNEIKVFRNGSRNGAPIEAFQRVRPRME